MFMLLLCVVMPSRLRDQAQGRCPLQLRLTQPSEGIIGGRVGGEGSTMFENIRSFYMNIEVQTVLIFRIREVLHRVRVRVTACPPAF